MLATSIRNLCRRFHLSFHDQSLKKVHLKKILPMVVMLYNNISSFVFLICQCLCKSVFSAKDPRENGLSDLQSGSKKKGVQSIWTKGCHLLTSTPFNHIHVCINGDSKRSCAIQNHPENGEAQTHWGDSWFWMFALGWTKNDK